MLDNLKSHTQNIFTSLSDKITQVSENTKDYISNILNEIDSEVYSYNEYQIELLIWVLWIWFLYVLIKYFDKIKRKDINDDLSNVFLDTLLSDLDSIIIDLDSIASMVNSWNKEAVLLFDSVNKKYIKLREFFLVVPSVKSANPDYRNKFKTKITIIKNYISDLSLRVKDLEESLTWDFSSDNSNTKNQLDLTKFFKKGEFIMYKWNIFTIFNISKTKLFVYLVRDVSDNNWNLIIKTSNKEQIIGINSKSQLFDISILKKHQLCKFFYNKKWSNFNNDIFIKQSWNEITPFFLCENYTLEEVKKYNKLLENYIGLLSNLSNSSKVSDKKILAFNTLRLLWFDKDILNKLTLSDLMSNKDVKKTFKKIFSKVHPDKFESWDSDMKSLVQVTFQNINTLKELLTRLCSS